MEKKRIKCKGIRIVLLSVLCFLILLTQAHAEKKDRIVLKELTVVKKSMASTANRSSPYGTPPGPPPMPDAPTYRIEDEPSSVVTAPQILKTAVKQTTMQISKRIANVIAPRSSVRTHKPSISLDADEYGMGISAGDSEQKFGIWANFAITDSKDDRLLYTTNSGGQRIFTPSNSRLDLYNYIFGMDYKITSNIVTGVALSYENMDGTTGYNSGDIESDGITVSPYFAASIGDFFSFDLTAGYSWIDIEQTRTDNDRKISSSPESKRIFFAANTNLYHSISNWNLTGNVGYLYAEDEQDAFKESDGTTVSSSTTKYGQITAGGEISYVITRAEPYLSIAYEYDTTYDDDISGNEYADYDRNGIVVGAGLRFLMTDSLNGDFQFSKVYSRNDYNEFSFMYNLRFDF